ncbi:MAG: ATP-binding protein [Steroidobacteraceae bacterium]
MTKESQPLGSPSAGSASDVHYRDLLSLIDEGYCVIEMIFDDAGKPIDYRFLEVNGHFEAQSGMHAATGKRVREFYPDLERYWFEFYGKVALTGEPAQFVNEAASMDGRWFEVHALRLGDASSRKVAILFKNISERKRIESDLYAALALAERANRAKSEFLSNMSHELRSPLNAILGFAQLLESGAPPPTHTQKDSVDQILKAGWYLLELINEILDLALIESGKLSMSLEPMSLTEVLRDCQAMIEPQAQKRRIGLAFTGLDGPLSVMADRTRVKQILINLLSNAIKYNSAGGTVRVTCGLVANGRVRIRVQDTGLGLTPEQLAQLFRPFERLGQEIGLEEGTGIGLAISKRMIELMGGTIGAESVVGVGSTFWIELGQRAPSTVEVDSVALPVVTDAQREATPYVSTVLYVEDNPANLLLVQRILARRPDIRLLSAVDGLSGVEVARCSLPDAIVMDINLPGISGTDARRLLAADATTAHIPVIALSANAMPHDIARGIEAGFCRYLTKPIKVGEFIDALDVALASTRASTATIQ